MEGRLLIVERWGFRHLALVSLCLETLVLKLGVLLSKVLARLDLQVPVSQAGGLVLELGVERGLVHALKRKPADLGTRALAQVHEGLLFVSLLG